MAKEKKDISNYIIVGMVSAVIGAGAAHFIAGGSAGTGEDALILKRIRETRKIIAEKGDPSFNEENANLGVLNGYLAGGGDQYAYYYNYSDEDPTISMTNDVNSAPTPVGSGFRIDKSENGNILIKEVVSGKAAEKQGLMVGDEITRIDGISVSEQGYENFARKILGKQDTEVKLTILRSGKEFEMTFKRDNAKQSEVQWEQYGDTAYIRITSFDDFAVGQLGLALDSFKNPKSVVIDLRNCLGGQNDSCVNLAGSFINKGKVVLRHFDGTEEIFAVKPDEVKLDVPMAVLVNENTASAAEIMAVMLQDNKQDCTLIGVNTYGKGIFQTESPLESGGKIHYTAGEFFVDDRENWHGVGIAPDVRVEMDYKLIGTDEDVQLQKALDLLD